MGMKNQYNSTPSKKTTKRGLSQSASKFQNELSFQDNVSTFKMYYINRNPLIEIKMKKNTVLSATSYYPDGQVMAKMSLGAADTDKLARNKPDLSMLYEGEEFHDSGLILYKGDMHNGLRFNYGEQYDLQGVKIYE